MNSFTQSVAICIQFFKRDCLVQWQKKNRYIIDYFLLYAPLYTLTYCILQPRIFFGPGNEVLGTTIFVGTLTLEILVQSMKCGIDVLLDLDKVRFIEYQLTLVNPRLFVLQKIAFATFFTFVITAPFYPIAKLIAGSALDISHVSWPLTYLVLLISSLFSASFGFACLFIARTLPRTANLWMRVYAPLIYLGGFWIPHTIMQKFSPVLGNLSLLNPVLYMTEALKTAFLGSSQFLPFSFCLLGLLGYTFIFTLIACYRFKRNVDHI